MRTENNKLYFSDEGKVFVRKSDNFIMGSGLDLGENDSIENYEEQDAPEGYNEENNENIINHE